VITNAARPRSARLVRCRIAAIVLAALGSASCAPRLLNLPAGPGEPAADGASVLAEATRACGGIRSLIAEGAVSGSVGGRRVRGRLHLGVTDPAAARLEAIAPFGQPLFIFVTRQGRATLLLTRPDRVLAHDNPNDVLHAITGVPLDAAELRATLTGCSDPASLELRRLEEHWRLARGSVADLYLRREESDAPWRLVARVHRAGDAPAWRVEYRDFEQDLPRTLRFVSPDRDQFDLRIVLSQVEQNTPLGDDAFEVRIPPAAVPITLEELRERGPLGALDAP
jgi:hypothetical protein